MMESRKRIRTEKERVYYEQLRVVAVRVRRELDGDDSNIPVASEEYPVPTLRWQDAVPIPGSEAGNACTARKI